MKTDLDAIQIVYESLVSGGGIGIDGYVYKLIRPVGSLKEDIVINSITANSEQLQTVVLNVNLYVSDIAAKINNQNQYLPNTARLNQLTNKLNDILENLSGSGYLAYIEFQHTLAEKEIQQHYMNTRLVFTFEPV